MAMEIRFSRAVMDGPDEVLLDRVREATLHLTRTRDAPDNLRDLGILLELDHEVRNGGFAQYLFNHSCLNAFDAWFATDGVEPRANELINLALRRFGEDGGVTLDLLRLAQGGGEAMTRAYDDLLFLYRRAHQEPVDVLKQFAHFRDRLGGDTQTSPGLDALSTRFFTETNLELLVLEHVRENRSYFLAKD